jgi:hypothetical protein
MSLQAQLDRIESNLAENTRSTIENTSALKEHMRRTELLEAAIEPIQKHVVRVKFLVPVISGAIGLITGAVELMHLLGKF